MFSVRRDHHNPLIAPVATEPWQASATFNPAPIDADGTVLLYRALSEKALYHNESLQLSTIGIAHKKRTGYDTKPFIEPKEDFDKFGCEDPRVTKIGDTYYIFYTAIGGMPMGPDTIKVAVALSKDLETIEERHIVTPFNAKAMTLYPEKVNGKWCVMFTLHSDLPPAQTAIAYLDRLEDLYSAEFWNTWYASYQDSVIDLRRDETEHVEIGAPPILINEGWLLVYSHIQDYFTEHDKDFGIEVVLLDRDNPCKVIKRSVFPYLVPEEAYEKFGLLPNIVFPTGAQLEGNNLNIYYGAADTYCCRASLPLDKLLESLSVDGSIKQYVKRSEKNPILKPIPEHDWESNYVLNPGAVEIDDTTYILYRALGHDNTSFFGLALTKDGEAITERLDTPVYVPRAEFESKVEPGILSGCEDARIVKIDKRLYITYTAYNGRDTPRVAVSSIAVEDFLARKWDAWSQPELISPEKIDDKDSAIFPRKIRNKHMILHRIDHHVCADFTNTLDFTSERLVRCIQLFGPRKGMWDHRKVGIAGPPLETKDGWLLFYHGITRAGHYLLGAVLLDKDDPTYIIGRTSQPIMSPVEQYEIHGWIENVVFPCGQVEREGVIYLYYGGSDQVVGVATIKTEELLSALRA